MLKQSTVQVFCAALSQALKEARLRKKLSMSAVAQRAGISQQMVSYVERGIRKPTVDTVFRISVALEVDLGRLVKSATKHVGE